MSVASESTINVSSAVIDQEKGAKYSHPVSQAPSTIAPEEAHYESPKGLRKFLIVTCLCGAQFFDIFVGCAAIVALPTIGQELNFTSSMLAWVLTAYTLTFGSFQVPAGRLSDIYHPRPVFCIGFLMVGVFSLICAVSVHPIMLIVFRALCGLAAAMTVPSAISILVQTFPDPKEKGEILALFGALGAIGNVVGLVVGGVLSSQVSWRWVFYLISIPVIPFAIVSVFIVPKVVQVSSETKRSLDLPGISALTAALILFVYAISDGNSEGWDSPQIITTLVLSIVLLVAFFVIERFVKDPALPPRTWSNKNFTPMFFYAWSAYWWLMVVLFQLVQVFQDLWSWSPLGAAVHMIPGGVAAGIGCLITSWWGDLLPRKVSLSLGQALMLIGAVLFALGNNAGHYWSYIFPGMVIGMVGVAWSYVLSSVTTMEGARKGEEGIIGAALYTSYQIGSTIGIAIATAITLGVNGRQPLDAVSQYVGYSASFWSLVAMHGIMIVIVMLFVKN